MMPADWKDKIGKHDAIYFGTGWPAKIPDHISLWGSLIVPPRVRPVSISPVRLMPGVPSPPGRSPATSTLGGARNTRAVFLGRRPHVPDTDANSSPSRP